MKELVEKLGDLIKLKEPIFCQIEKLKSKIKEYEKKNARMEQFR